MIDDHPDSAQSLAAVLQSDGYEAKAITDPREALGVAQQFRPAVACIDIAMPHVDGYQLALLFRADRHLSSVCLVAITAWGDERARHLTAAAGFDDHLVKPPRMPDLTAAIDRCLTRGGT